MSEQVHYFSNGTEHEMWSYYWCDGCVHDHSTHRREPDTDNGCPLIVQALIGEAVDEWTKDDRYVMNPSMRVRCTKYQGCDCPMPSERPDPPVYDIERRLLAAVVNKGHALASAAVEMCDELDEWDADDDHFGETDGYRDLPMWFIKAIWLRGDAKGFQDAVQRYKARATAAVG